MTVQFSSLAAAGGDLAALRITAIYVAPLYDMSEPGQADRTWLETCAAEDAELWGLYGCVAVGDHIALHHADDVGDLVKMAVTVMDELTVCLGYKDSFRQIECVGLQELCERLTELIRDEVWAGFVEQALRDDCIAAHPLTPLRDAVRASHDDAGKDDDDDLVVLDAAERETIVAALLVWQAMGGNSHPKSKQTYAETTALIERLKGETA